MKKLFGLLGYPLSHSFSKEYFKNKFEREGVCEEFEYRNFELENLDSFIRIIEEDKSLVGLNVTIPYKKEVLRYLDKLSPAAESIRAVNTILIRRTDGISLEGYNTDWIGFSRSLQKMIGDARPKALILGTGGSSKAVEYVLKSLGIKYKFVSREVKQMNCVDYLSLKKREISKSKLIINTTPLGMFPHVDTLPDINYDFLTKEHFLFDLVYNPAETSFLLEGAKRGCTIKNGLEMLELQAEASWEIWNNLQ